MTKSLIEKIAVYNQTVIENPDIRFFYEENIPILKAKQYSCFCTTLEKHKNVIVSIREKIKSVYQDNKYFGFSDIFDKYFDDFSCYVYVVDENFLVVGNQRITFKKDINLLPLEMGIVNTKDAKRYVLDQQHVCEITSFFSINKSVFKLLIDSVIQVCIENEIDKAYALLDPSDTALVRLYKRLGWRKSKKFPTPIYFRSYGRIIDKKVVPTLWTILELSMNHVCSLSRRDYS